MQLPFVKRTTYDDVVSDCNKYYDWYWSQAKRNYAAENERVLKKLQKATQQLTRKITGY